MYKFWFTTIIVFIFKTSGYNVEWDGLCSRSNRYLIQILISDGSVPMWKKDNSTFAIGDFLFNNQNNRIKLEEFCHDQGNKLVISLAELSDSGEYSCEISHKTTLPMIKHIIQVRRKEGLLFIVYLNHIWIGNHIRFERD